MKFKHTLSLFSFLLICIVLPSSVLLNVDLTETYYPMSDKAKNEKSLLTKLDRQYERDLENLPKKYKKLYKEVYTARYEQLQAKINEKHYIYDEELLEYIDDVLTEIYEANPRIPKGKIRPFIDRGTSANAYCTGEGTIAINVGLLHLLENESQLAFILCHEIAHLTLDHVNRNIERGIEKFKDKDARNEMNEKYRVINKMSNNRTKAIVKMKRDIYYAESRHSRLNESSADKKGMEYFLNTSFDPLEAANTMLVLVGTDSLKYNKPLDLKSHFDNNGFEFKDRWLKVKESNFNPSDDDDWLEDYVLKADSLKTHPDCMKRKAALDERLAEEYSLDSLSSKKASPEFLLLKQRAEFEWIESYFYYGRLDLCLYNSLQLLQKYPDNAYLHSMIGLCWIHMAYAQENYELNLHIGFPKRNTPPSLKPLLEMIQNVGLSEMKKIANSYLKSKDEEYLNDEHFLFAIAASEYQIKNQQRFKELKSLYFKTFPEGLYKFELENL